MKNKLYVNTKIRRIKSDKWNIVYVNLKENYEFNPCSYLWSRMLIFWNGEVVPCCRDYEGANLNMGSVLNETVKNIWLSKNYMNLRKEHLEGKRLQMDMCGNCDISTKKKL